MIFAFSVLPLLLAAAVAIDYTRAAMVRGRLSAVADAAALVATTPGMMSQPATTAQAAVVSMFAAQATLINGVASIAPAS